jgi:carboxyl-terminal processing protease
MQPRTIRFILAIAIAGLLGYYLGVTKVKVDWANYQPHVAIAGKEPPPGVTNVDFSMMWVVLDKLQQNYYDKSKIVPQKLVNGAIGGMVDSLDDPFTMYLPPTQNTDFKQGLAGQFEGIGAELGLNGKQIIVMAPLAGSPAEKAGIKAGDAILKIEKDLTAGWSLNQVVDKIRGPKGTTVKLTILHKGEDVAKELTITRDTITVKSVTSWVKKVKDISGITMTNTLKAAADQKVAYIRLSQFGDNTNQEWVGIANSIDLARKNDPSVKGVVLDLRNNPGGYLTDAVFIASEFVDSGTIVMQEDASGARAKLDVSRKGLLTDLPVMVLINRGSASASEIVTGALLDHGRAKTVGEQSFGKGTVQEAEDLGGGAGLHVTIAKWLTPNGTWVHKVGITPDFPVNLNPKEPTRDTQLEKAVEQLVK